MGELNAGSENKEIGQKAKCFSSPYSVMKLLVWVVDNYIKYIWN